MTARHESQLNYSTLGNLYVLINLPGGPCFWELVSEGGGVVVPTPGPAGTSQGEAGEVQGGQQQAAMAEQEDGAVGKM